MADVVPRYRTLDLGWGEDAQVPWISLNGDVLSHIPWTSLPSFGIAEVQHVVKHGTCTSDVEMAGAQSVQHQLFQGSPLSSIGMAAAGVAAPDSGQAFVAPVSSSADYSVFCADHQTLAPQPLLPCVEQQPNLHIFNCADDRAVARNMLDRKDCASSVDVCRVSSKNTADLLIAHGNSSTSVDLGHPWTSSTLAVDASASWPKLTHIGHPSSTVAHDISSASRMMIPTLPTYHFHYPNLASPGLWQGDQHARAQAATFHSSHSGHFSIDPRAPAWPLTAGVIVANDAQTSYGMQECNTLSRYRLQ